MINTVESTYQGYKMQKFDVEGRESLLVVPEHPLPGNPWIWRAEFFGAFDAVDMDMVRRGWHLGYHTVSNMYGCPESIDMMDTFYNTVTREFALSAKTVLFGFSRGGLYSVNYAATHPEHVAALYLDAPVLDIRSWPGGKWNGDGAPDCWTECLGWYKLTEETAMRFDRNPMDRAEALASLGMPLIIVAGGADTVVPFAENSEKFLAIYEKSDAPCKLILKPDCGHHPHSLEDPTPVSEFLMQYALPIIQK